MGSVRVDAAGTTRGGNARHPTLLGRNDGAGDTGTIPDGEHTRNARLELSAALRYPHIHLLVVPETEIALARGIGLTNQVYTQYLNRKLNQSGRVWQNRFFSCVVENEKYLWSVARYIERNPLKVGLVEKTETYRWSSAKAHISGAKDTLLGATTWLSPQEQSSYAEFVVTEDEETDNAIRRATRTGRPFGSESFVDLLEFQLNQPLKGKKRGRPYKTNGECP